MTPGAASGEAGRVPVPSKEEGLLSLLQDVIQWGKNSTAQDCLDLIAKREKEAPDVTKGDSPRNQPMPWMARIFHVLAQTIVACVSSSIAELYRCIKRPLPSLVLYTPLPP